jgi:hypothetical protein
VGSPAGLAPVAYSGDAGDLIVPDATFTPNSIDHTPTVVTEAATINLAQGGTYYTTATGTLATVNITGSATSAPAATRLYLKVTGDRTLTFQTSIRADDSVSRTSYTFHTGNHPIAFVGVPSGTSGAIEYWVTELADAPISYAGVITPTTLSGDVNDYNPTGFGDAFTVRINGGAADRNITGLSAGSGRADRADR